METSSPDRLSLPARRTAPPRTALGRFFLSGRPLDKPATGAEHTRPWYLVLWLTGVDYFSTLGYQPGIALLAVGVLSVPATVVLVLVTLFGAVPVYGEVARRSYAGLGSIALLENLFSGWKSKLFVLVLLGFAGTDFVITMTLSAADAARHAIANPFLHPYLGDSHIATTLMLLAVARRSLFAGISRSHRPGCGSGNPVPRAERIRAGLGFQVDCSAPWIVVAMAWKPAFVR